ncbi:MAG: amidohydrolase family protein [Victivallales bacterium]|nr:amidohydrolase family protein [Victivallales bacterium]MBT7303366.1 amidohydrolase family protein [Victivallales bacterium]
MGWSDSTGGKGSFGVGPDRFLFGTDFPICNPALLLQGVLFEHLSDAEQEAVLGGNFRRLVGWREK